MTHIYWHVLDSLAPLADPASPTPDEPNQPGVLVYLTWIFAAAVVLAVLYLAARYLLKLTRGRSGKTGGA
ncbi:hypothetical protein [Pseudonocardia acaciae]|uniref:hypothetical protein n=1 Tax=Pseudonocardia acaciae TaxID=551276 RepID=UPI00048D7026|nr:hypothetical protein [Pseudonocardia acaciae]